MNQLRTGMIGLSLLLALSALGTACGPARQGVDVAALPLDAPPPPPAPRALAFPAERAETLPNGLTVVVLPLPGSATVSLHLGIPGGLSREPVERAGVGGITAEALKLGVPTMDAATLAGRIESLGSSISFGCDADDCTGQAEALARNLEPTLALFADVVIRPTFPADEIRRLKGEWLAYLAYLESQPSHAGFVVTHRLLYGDHPYARYAPTADGLSAVTRDDVVDFHRRYMTPRGAVLVAAGDVEPEAFFALVRAAFADWDAPLPAPEALPAPAVPASEPVVHLVDRPGAVQATVLVAHRAMPRTAPGYLAARVADEVLGGGAARRLFLDLREEKGLTYGAGSHLDAQQLAGHTIASAAVRNEKVGEALQALLGHIERIRQEPVPKAELDDAERYLAGALALQLDHPGRVAQLVLRQRLLDLPKDEWRSWPRRVQAVGADEVLTAAKALWSAPGLVIVVVGDAAALAPQLEPIRKVKRYAATGEPVAAK